MGGAAVLGLHGAAAGAAGTPAAGGHRAGAGGHDGRRGGAASSQPVIPDLTQFTPLTTLTEIALGSFTVGISRETGAIERLVDARGREWCDKTHTIGRMQYDVYNAQDYDR